MWTEKNGKLYFILVGFGGSVNIEESFALPVPENNIYTAPEQKEKKRTFLSDVYSLGMTFKVILSTCKIKVSEEIENVINEMCNVNVERRPSVSRALGVILNYSFQSHIHKHIDVYKVLSQKKLFKIPPLSDIQVIRRSILTPSRKGELTIKPLNSPKNESGSPLIGHLELKNSDTVIEKVKPNDEDRQLVLEEFKIRENNLLSTLKTKEEQLEKVTKEVNTLTEFYNKEISIKDNLLNIKASELQYKDEIIKVKDQMIETKNKIITERDKEIEILKEQIKNMNKLLDQN